MAFRLRESKHARDALASSTPAVIALGGGAVGTDLIRSALRERALTILVEVDADEAWRRVAGSDRPLGQDEAAFRTLYEQRRPLYDDAADARAKDVDGVVLAAGGVHVETGVLERLGELVPGDGPVELVSDAHVAGIYGMDAQLALGARARGSHELAPGEEAKSVESSKRSGTRCGSTAAARSSRSAAAARPTSAGFAASTYLRGIDWVAVPTTLVGQVDAAIGGKTAIDLPGGKNLVGAFHWPVRTVIDPATLETLPQAELENGRAELVKTGLLAGEPLWELPLPEQVRRCAPSRPRSACATRTTAASARSSTSATRSRTRSRRPPTSSCRTGAPSRSGCSPRCRLSGLDTAAVEETLGPSPSASTVSAPGRRSPATRRSSPASRGSSCSRRPAGRSWASSGPPPRSEPRSTR